MTKSTVTSVLKGDSIAIPTSVRERFGLKDGSVRVVEADDEGIRLRPVGDPDVEIYTPERIAEFLLNNVADDTDYAWAIERVREMGLDPKAIPHLRPRGAIHRQPTCRRIVRSWMPTSSSPLHSPTTSRCFACGDSKG